MTILKDVVFYVVVGIALGTAFYWGAVLFFGYILTLGFTS